MFNSSTAISCIANLTNTILGAGVLGLPHALASTGSLTGVILLTVASSFSAFGLHLLSVCALAEPISKQEASSFYKVARRAYPPATMLIDFAVAFKCFGVSTSYLTIIGDCMTEVMAYFLDENSTSVVLERDFWIPFAVLMVSTLCFFKSLDALKFTSLLSCCFVLFLTLVIFCYFLNTKGLDPCEGFVADDSEDVCKGDTPLTTNMSDTISVLAVFIFSFTCHQNIFSVCNELQDNTQARVNKVIVTSISSAFLLNLAISLFGYYTFGAAVDSDILKSYPQNALVTILRFFIALLVTFSYPLQLDPSRRCCMTLINQVREYSRNRGGGNDGDDGAEDKEALVEGESSKKGGDEYIWFAVTVFYLAGSFLIAMVVSDLGTILGLVGATGSTTVTYILPGFIYLKTFPEGKLKWLAVLQLCLGLVIMPIALYYTLK
jgi:amino acid permease